MTRSSTQTNGGEKQEAWRQLAIQVSKQAAEVGALAARLRLTEVSPPWPDPRDEGRTWSILVNSYGDVWMDQEETRPGRGSPRSRCWSLLKPDPLPPRRALIGAGKVLSAIRAALIARNEEMIQETKGALK